MKLVDVFSPSLDHNSYFFKSILGLPKVDELTVLDDTSKLKERHNILFLLRNSLIINILFETHSCHLESL